MKILGEFDAILKNEISLCQASINEVNGLSHFGLLSYETARRLYLFQSDLFEANGNVDSMINEYHLFEKYDDVLSDRIGKLKDYQDNYTTIYL